MTESKSTTTDTYEFPASSHEASLRSAQEQALLTEARTDAMREAVSGQHELNPDDVDAHRIEGLGASTLAAMEGAPATQPEVFYDPTNPEQQRLCGEHVLRMRQYALAA